MPSRAVRAALARQPSLPSFAVDHHGGARSAMVLPLTSAGQGAWRGTKQFTHNGANYELGSDGKAARATERDGAAMRFARSPNGDLQAADVVGRQGWTVKGERNGKGAIWTARSPKGRAIVHRYDAKGWLDQVTVDGMMWSRYRYTPDHAKVNIEYADHSEQRDVPIQGRK